jgi:hypothetical protein
MATNFLRIADDSGRTTFSCQQGLLEAERVENSLTFVVEDVWGPFDNILAVGVLTAGLFSGCRKSVPTTSSSLVFWADLLTLSLGP